MRNRYIPAFIMLIAGAITCFFDIYHKTELLSSLKRLFWVLIIFYIIGLIARAIINKVLVPKNNDIKSDNELEYGLENASEEDNNSESTDKEIDLLNE